MIFFITQVNLSRKIRRQTQIKKAINASKKKSTIKLSVLKAKVQRENSAAAQRTIEARKSLKKGASRRATGRRNAERRRCRAPQEQLGATTWQQEKIRAEEAGCWKKRSSKKENRPMMRTGRKQKNKKFTCLCLKAKVS